MPDAMVTVGSAVTMMVMVRKAIEDNRLGDMVFMVEYIVQCVGNL
jgi:hypothetical protein